jgi:hypothetical protein
MDSLKQFFAKRKTTALLAAVSSVAVYEFTQIHVPDCITDRFAYRVKRLVELAIKNIVCRAIAFAICPRSRSLTHFVYLKAFFGSKFSLGSEIELLRATVNFFIQPQNLTLLYPSLTVKHRQKLIFKNDLFFPSLCFIFQDIEI